MTNDPNSKKESGLPEVAQDNHKKNPIFLVVLAILLIAIFSMYFHTRASKKSTTSIEENYSMLHYGQNENPVIKPMREMTSIPDKKDQKEKEELSEKQLAFILQKQKELQERLSAPLMVVNGNQTNKVTGPNSATSSTSRDLNTQFMNQVSAQNPETITASLVAPLSAIVAEGSLIHAILESASNSDLPGYLRAIVSEPSYSEDGSQILIPRGTRLIGQYKSGMLQGQSRIFIVWTRLITPSGISLNLGSPGVDSLGVAGMGADEIDRHFWERFGTASLLAIIGAGAANIGVSGSDEYNSASAYRSAVASSFSQSANQSLQQESMIAPTLKSYQGKPIMVFVAHDLNFQGALRQVKPNMNVF